MLIRNLIAVALLTLTTVAHAEAPFVELVKKAPDAASAANFRGMVQAEKLFQLARVPYAETVIDFPDNQSPDAMRLMAETAKLTVH